MSTTRQRLHWRTPMTMIACLLAGIGLAVSHHAFYATINTKSVSGRPFNIAGWETTQQQATVIAGTALAFLFKASLVFCASIAYMQLFFGLLHSRSIALDKVDNWFSALDDLPSLLSITTYYRYPALAVVALTAWLLPISAVFSPAALSVVFDKISPSRIAMMQVPQPAFDSLAFGSAISTDGLYGRALMRYANGTHTTMNGPSDEVSRIANTVAALGEILEIEAPGTNASYQVTFEGPRLSCVDLEQDVRAQVKDNLFVTLKRATNYSAPNPTTVENGESADSSATPKWKSMFSYLSWINTTNGLDPTGRYMLPSNQTPFYDVTNTSQGGLRIQSTDFIMGIDFVDLLVGVFPRAISYHIPDIWRGKTEFDKELMDWYFEDATLLRCELGAANYTIQVAYTGVNQDQHIRLVSQVDVPRVAKEVTAVSFDLSNTTDPGSPEYALQDDWSKIEPDMKGASYMAMLQAVFPLIWGANNARGSYLGTAGLYNPDLYDDTAFSTNVFSTALAQTKELSQFKQGEVTPEDLANATHGLAFDQASSLLSQTRDTVYNRSLKAAIEELFFNTTISMASSKALLYNAPSPYVPRDVEVTFKLYGNIFLYLPQRLWLAYGIALGVSIINLSLGLWAMLSSRAAFTLRFTTIARVVGSAEIDACLEEEVPGKDPLPKSVGLATIKLSNVKVVT